ncbi:MAG: GDSL-type esterase/lipase family protein [Opitutaceae bacterium]
MKFPAASPEIIIEGRHVLTPEGTAKLGFPGTVFHMTFRGDSLSFQVKASSDDVYFDVSVDGGPQERLHALKGEGTYPLCQSAARGEHRVELTRRTESWQGTCEILGFETNDEGCLLPSAPLPGRKLMFIGDSITGGESTDLRQGEAPLGNHRANARLSYGIVLARRLGAQCHLVSYGGRGVIRDWQGIRDTRNAPQFYELALPDGPAIAWDPKRYVPDAIGICLGTNDFNQGIPDQNEFINAYVEFVRKVRRDAPNAVIVLIESPIVHDAPGKSPLGSVLKAYIGGVIARIADPRVIQAPVSHAVGTPVDAHPTGREHEIMASELEPVFRRALGWM